MPNGPMLGTDQALHTGAQRDFHVDSAWIIERTCPTDASFDDGADHVGVHNRIRLWWDAQPNGPRLSCGALKKKGVIQYPTRAASFKRLLGGSPLV